MNFSTSAVKIEFKKIAFKKAVVLKIFEKKYVSLTRDILIALTSIKITILTITIK